MQDFRLVIGLVGLYFMVILGMVVYGRVKSTKSFLPGLNEFFLAGKNLSPLVLTFTYVGSLFSTFSVLGMPGFAYSHGLASIIFYILGSTIGITFLFFVGKKIRQFAEGKRVFSPIEIVSQSYQSRRLGLFIAVIFTFFLMPYVSLQLVGIGTFIESYTDGAINYAYGVGAMMVIVLLYLFLGGMRVVAYTDFIQLLAIMVGLALGAGYLLHHYDLGLFETFTKMKQISPEHFTPPGPKGYFETPMLVTYILITLGIFVQPHLLTRAMMAKSDRDINYMVVGSFIGLFLLAFFAVFYSFLATVTAGDDLQPNMMMGHLFKQMAGFGFWGLFLSSLMLMGALGAAMSTADSLLLAIGQVCTRDMVRPFFKVARDRQVLLSKGIMFLVLLGAFLTGLNPPKFILDLGIYSAAGSVVLAPTIIAFQWHRRSMLASYISITVGLVILCILAVYKAKMGYAYGGMNVGGIPMVVSFILYFGICLIRKPRLEFAQ